MSDKTDLFGRHGSVRDASEEQGALSYTEYRNQQALRAWRERCARALGEATPARRRTWLFAWRSTDSAAPIR